MHQHDIILHAVWKKRMWVTAGSFPEWGRVGCWLKVRGEKAEYQSWKTEVNIGVLPLYKNKCRRPNCLRRHVGASLLAQFLQKKQLYTTAILKTGLNQSCFYMKGFFVSTCSWRKNIKIIFYLEEITRQVINKINLLKVFSVCLTSTSVMDILESGKNMVTQRSLDCSIWHSFCSYFYSRVYSDHI